MVAVVEFYCCLGLIHDQGAGLDDEFMVLTGENLDINRVV
jgi:hypothetical protein